MKEASKSSAASRDRKPNREKQVEKNGNSIVTSQWRSLWWWHVRSDEMYELTRGMFRTSAHVFHRLVWISVPIPEQPDWLFQRPMLTMDFVPDSEPPNEVAVFSTGSSLRWPCHVTAWRFLSTRTLVSGRAGRWYSASRSSRERHPRRPPQLYGSKCAVSSSAQLILEEVSILGVTRWVETGLNVVLLL